MQEFTLVFREGLARGLREKKTNPRNAEALVECQGMFPETGIVRALDDLSSYDIDTSALGCSYPFPQLFVLKNMVLVCTKTNIYEYAGGSLSAVFEGATAGSVWTLADYGRFIIMTNGACLLHRDAENGDFSLYTNCDIPTCLCLADVNGQIFVGAPGISVEEDYLG